MNKVIIIIPIYKQELDEFEKIALIQCCKILKRYNFSLVCPEILNVESYLNILDFYNINYKIERFGSIFFKSVKKYNHLMLNVYFYERFNNYEFMLIYQLDAYVFRDDLNYWCKMNYDYIGAPWFENYNISDNNSKLLRDAGNGGFSLRKIKSFINILNIKGDNKIIINRYIREGRNEDGFFSMKAKNIDKNFRVAPPEVAMNFSFECLPKRLYKMTNNQLPFGCHAWLKYDPVFWNTFINFDLFKAKQRLSVNIFSVFKMDIIKIIKKLMNSNLKDKNI